MSYSDSGVNKDDPNFIMEGRLQWAAITIFPTVMAICLQGGQQDTRPE
ncbi:MAG: hypothetical protein WCE96_07685 [Nitrososphaeraceae archaeon]